MTSPVAKETVDPDFEALLKVAAEDVSSWDSSGTGDNVSIFKKMTDDSPIVLVKVYAIMEGILPSTVFEVMTNQEIRRQWDKVLSNFEILEDNPAEGRSVLYYIVKTPIGTSNRDFLQQRKIKRDFPTQGTYTMHFKSVTHERMPEKPKIVRADTLISGYIIEPSLDEKGRPSTKLTIISQNDIKGIVPKAIVNIAASRAPRQWVNNLVKGCLDYQNNNFK